MRSCHCLQIRLGIPVRIKEYDGIGSHQVNPKATGSSRKQEGKVTTIWSIEMFNRKAARAGCYSAIKSLVGVAACIHVVGKNIQHPNHLTEYQNSMAIPFQLSKQLIE